MGWEYRIGTYIKNYPKQNRRCYIIMECYYDSQGAIKYHANCTSINLIAESNVNVLKLRLNDINKAFDRPIIDLDNFPNEYKISNVK